MRVAAPDTDLIAKLRSALVLGPRLKLAVLFGSRALGAPRSPRSDVDVGIVPFDSALDLRAELSLASALSGAVALEIDLVRLDREEPVLDREVAVDGVCLYEEAPGVFAAWRAEAASRFIEFEETIAPHRERFLRRLAGGRV